jgi:predicted enzyme related to lactoylglutathione lyase
MADPFEALRLPPVAVDPDPTFAARLRSRVERALALPEGVTVSNLTIEDLSTPVPGPAVADSGGPGVVAASIVPYLIVDGARRAVAWYVAALGATARGDVITMPDGRIGHAELELRGSVVYLADESPESDVAAPRPGAGATVSLTFAVPDVDGAVERAVAHGAVLERTAADNPYGRNAVIRDPFGHRWILSAVTAAVGASAGDDALRQGDLAYVSLWVPDIDRATAFFSAVLGWTYAPQAEGHARQVVGRELNHGLFGGQDRSTLFLCFVVDDIEAAVERVRVAGGRAEAPASEFGGQLALCVDIEGTSFALYQPPPGPRGRRPATNGERQGDLSYITMEVRDSAAVRAFYGAVLGWHFNPGRVEDGWGPADVVPMVGLHGGHQMTTVLPMYRVDDIEATVARVRAGGGSATDPESHPYGLSSLCVDDQGTRFYLGQL